MIKVFLKKKREASLLRRHPWVFSGAVNRMEGDPGTGDRAEVFSSDGAWLTRAAYSPASTISLRVWTFDSAEAIDTDFFRRRLCAAIEKRNRLADPAGPGVALRLVNAESDGLPGLIVDRYADYLVCQFLAAGVESHKAEIVSLLEQIVPCLGIYERSDSESRLKEGLKKASGILAGNRPPELVEIREGPFRCLVDLVHGHKTGCYLDQGENRRLIGRFCGGARVLDAFAYTGGFGLWALQAGAAGVVNIESSKKALDLARQQLVLNGFDGQGVQSVCGDVFRSLRGFRDAGERFDVIILDPPKFADSVGQVQRACRGYKDINMIAFQLLSPGGILFTFSCSHHVTPELFQKVVAGAALDACCDAQIVGRLSQAADHPVGLHFPEGNYLKGLICRK